MALDLAVLLIIAVAAVLGAVSGALRQVVQLAAVALGWLAARRLGTAVAEGLGRSLPPLVARSVASAVLFLGVAALVSLTGALVLRGTGVARAVRGPTDRGVGALLGGVKAGAVIWVLLSALALAGEAAPRAFALDPHTSEFAALARRYNLLERLAPEPVRALERLRGGGQLRLAPTPGALREELERRGGERAAPLRP
jgi:membrane protein required for colicin V production